MKHGKRPTRLQKIAIKAAGLNPENWLVVKNCGDGLEVVHRHSGKTRTITKEVVKDEPGRKKASSRQ